MRVLLVEDEAKVSTFVSRGLSAERFAVDVARDGKTGLELAKTYEYDHRRAGPHAARAARHRELLRQVTPPYKFKSAGAGFERPAMPVQDKVANFFEAGAGTITSPSLLPSPNC